MMQHGVKQKRRLKVDEINSVILKILVILMVSLAVSCSFLDLKKGAHSRSLKAGDYFGGTSAGFWAQKSYVPSEIENRSSRTSQSLGVLE